MEAEISRKSENEVTDNLNAVPANFGSSASSIQTVSYTMEAEALIESLDEVSESLDAQEFNPPLNVSAAALPADFGPSASTSQTFSYTMEAEALIESKNKVTECRCARIFNSSVDVSTTFASNLEPSGSSSQMLSHKMEAEVLIESKDEVTECLDARVYNLALNITPAAPADIGPSTSSGQASSTEHSTGNPDSKKGWLFPAEIKQSTIYSQTPSIEKNTHPNPQKGMLFPLPTKTVQNPAPKVTAPRKFQIAHYFPNKDASSYELEKFKENRMIIFNHDSFRDGSTRPGTAKDEKLLRETFGKFRFKIEPTHKNYHKSLLLGTVKKFAQDTTNSAYGCICVAILTHGHETPGFLKAFDRRYSEYEIFKYFDASQNSALAAKPIIFLIQACRGPEPSPTVTTGGNTPAPKFVLDLDLENYHLPTEADRIVFHSSYVGRPAVRDPKNGSWFIQKLCEKINQYALTHDLETIFRLVRRTVALDCKTDEDWKQMPVVTSTTLREVYLAPNLQQADEQPRPASAYDLVRQPNDPDVYPLSHQHAERLKEHVCLRESTEMISVPDASPALMQLHHLPCCCFVEYFEYLKNCLESFSSHNKEDLVAKSLLKMVEQTGSGSEYNLQKFSYIQSMWEHFETNRNSFPPDGFSFVHRMYMPLKESDTERLEPL